MFFSYTQEEMDDMVYSDLVKVIQYDLEEFNNDPDEQYNCWLDEYNAEEDKKAEEEDREPVYYFS